MCKYHLSFDNLRDRILTYKLVVTRIRHFWHIYPNPTIHDIKTTSQRVFYRTHCHDLTRMFIQNSTYYSPADIHSGRGKECRCGLWFAWADSKCPWVNELAAIFSVVFLGVKHSPRHFLPCSYLPYFTRSRSKQWWWVHVQWRRMTDASKGYQKSESHNRNSRDHFWISKSKGKAGERVGMEEKCVVKGRKATASIRLNPWTFISACHEAVTIITTFHPCWA